MASSSIVGSQTLSCDTIDSMALKFNSILSPLPSHSPAGLAVSDSSSFFQSSAYGEKKDNSYVGASGVDGHLQFKAAENTVQPEELRDNRAEAKTNRKVS